jgi:hypothetical protein
LAISPWEVVCLLLITSFWLSARMRVKAEKAEPGNLVSKPHQNKKLRPLRFRVYRTSTMTQNELKTRITPGLQEPSQRR